MRTTIVKALTAGVFSLAVLASANQPHAAEAIKPIDMDWPFSGVFGSFDQASLQRGLQVYQNVCQSCHGLKYVAFRTLPALGYDEEQVKAIAAQYSIEDGPNDLGDMYQREGRPSDRFPDPFPNDQAARAANGGAYPPDLSLITKARGGGPDYIYSVLVGYKDPPADTDVPIGQYYNEYYPGHLIAMPQPLYPDLIEYADGTSATVDQMAYDVTNFLHWAAEPKLEERKQTGLKVGLFLLVMGGIFYAYKRRTWADVH